MRRRSRSEVQWWAQNFAFKQTKLFSILSKGKVSEALTVVFVAVGGSCVAVDAAGGLTVVFVAAGEPCVAFDAVGGSSVVLCEGWNGTRSPADCSTGWALAFAQRSTQNGASIAAGSFDALCVESSSVLS